jgi:hypothetical protein
MTAGCEPLELVAALQRIDPLSIHLDGVIVDKFRMALYSAGGYTCSGMSFGR